MSADERETIRAEDFVPPDPPSPWKPYGFDVFTVLGGADGREAGRLFVREWARRLEARRQKNRHDRPIVTEALLADALESVVFLGAELLPPFEDAPDNDVYVSGNDRAAAVEMIQRLIAACEKTGSRLEELLAPRVTLKDPKIGVSFPTPSLLSTRAALLAELEIAEQLPVRPERKRPKPTLREELMAVYRSMTGEVGITRDADRGDTTRGEGFAFAQAVLARLRDVKEKSQGPRTA